MRLRSLLAVMLIGIAGLGLSGCGSNGNNGSEFLATTVEMQQATTGNLTFNFERLKPRTPSASTPLHCVSISMRGRVQLPSSPRSPTLPPR